MKVTDQLIAGIHQPARALSHEDIKDLAKDTLFHPFTCGCEGCLKFNKAIGNKEVKAPSVTMTLAQSFKNVTRGDGGGRARLPAHSVKVEDEAGPKKKKKTSEKLLDSLVAKLK